MLAHDRVIFAERQLLGLGARVLLGHIEEAGVSRADELDLDGGRLGHCPRPSNTEMPKTKKAASPPLALRGLCPMPPAKSRAARPLHGRSERRRGGPECVHTVRKWG